MSRGASRTTSLAEVYRPEATVAFTIASGWIGEGLGDAVARIPDGHFSSGTYGLVEEGDSMEEAELERRRAAWLRPAPPLLHRGAGQVRPPGEQQLPGGGDGSGLRFRRRWHQLPR
jgi:hypothetical protein